MLLIKLLEDNLYGRICIHEKREELESFFFSCFFFFFNSFFLHNGIEKGSNISQQEKLEAMKKDENCLVH